jgi:hypothetical protein
VDLMPYIESIREKIEKLSENEAKSLLMIIYARLLTVNKLGNDHLKQLFNELEKVYAELPDQ